MPMWRTFADAGTHRPHEGTNVRTLAADGRFRRADGTFRLRLTRRSFRSRATDLLQRPPERSQAKSDETPRFQGKYSPYASSDPVMGQPGK